MCGCLICELDFGAVTGLIEHLRAMHPELYGQEYSIIGPIPEEEENG